jgi:ubiquinol-cytochrome c reductase cytochrome b subunit
MKLGPLLRGAGDAADNRLRAAKPMRKALRHIFPDHWSFLLGEIALYSFIVLLLTGTFLTLFFQPSMSDLIYHGSYVKLDGVHMSEAYASTLRISFDVRGGLLMRQIHHWAALVFVAAIVTHMLRIFFTGAFRKPREANWVIGTTLFVLAAAEGFCGYSLPDDLLSGTGLRTAEGIMLSIPVIGTYVQFFVFGGQFPGHDIVPRLYIVHVLVIPGLLLALISAHLLSIWHQEHTQWPGGKRRESNTVGVPLYPIFMAKTGALFFFTFGVLALLATVAQINPIWLYGPYHPQLQSAGSQPDWYIGFLEGALRLMPGVVTNVGGHTIAWNVFLPAAFLPAVFFFLMYLYPFFEQYATGDRRHHHILDRPRNVPTRTGIGVGIVAMGGDLLLASGDDIIAYRFGIPLEYLVWALQAGFFVFPVLLFFAARYACLALQRRDARRLAAGIPTGIIEQLPEGGYREQTRAVPDGQREKLEARPPDALILPTPRHVIPLPTPRRAYAQLRVRLNHFYTRYWVETPSGDGQQGRYEARIAQQQADGGPDGREATSQAAQEAHAQEGGKQ